MFGREMVTLSAFRRRSESPDPDEDDASDYASSDVEKSSFYVWFLGAGGAGDEKRTTSLLFRRKPRSSASARTVAKATLHVTSVGVAVVHSPDSVGGSELFLPRAAFVSVRRTDDVVTARVDGNEYSFRCDCEGTAALLGARLKSMLAKGMGSDGRSSSDSGSDLDPPQRVADLYDSLAADFRDKLYGHARYSLVKTEGRISSDRPAQTTPGQRRTPMYEKFHRKLERVQQLKQSGSGSGASHWDMAMASASSVRSRSCGASRVWPWEHTGTLPTIRTQKDRSLGSLYNCGEHRNTRPSMTDLTAWGHASLDATSHRHHRHVAARSLFA